MGDYHPRRRGCSYLHLVSAQLTTFAPMTKVVLNKKISNRVENGHPWIFANEVNTVEGAPEGGDIVDVFTHDKKFIGRGYINPKSQIIVRLLTRNKNEQVNDDFFYNRLLQAWHYKSRLGYRENC